MYQKETLHCNDVGTPMYFLFAQKYSSYFAMLNEPSKEGILVNKIWHLQYSLIVEVWKWWLGRVTVIASGWIHKSLVSYQQHSNSLELH